MGTKKKYIDDIKNILTDFSLTDESKLDDHYLSYKFDQYREDYIIKTYKQTGVIDRSWLTDLSLVRFHSVNMADDPNVTYCKCDISKAFVPKVVSLISPEGGNTDLGFYAIMSTCGTKSYYPKPINVWKDIAAEHIYSKLNFYDRIDTALYVNKKVTDLRMITILANPEDGYIISSEPIANGDLVAGQTYIVKYKQIFYDGVIYAANSTFTAQPGFTTFTGNGTIYLADQLTALSRTQPYPLNGDIAAQIVRDICVKEFQIAAGSIPDIRNDSQDDEVKAKETQESVQ